MRYRRIALVFATLSACYATATAAAAECWRSTVSAIGRFVELSLAFLANPTSIMPTFARLAVAGTPALAYDAPPQHFLRHEAGTARRAADRHT